MSQKTISSEYIGADFGDVRRSSRLVRLAEQMHSEPGASFPDALDEGQLEGAYRFFGNPNVTTEGILAPHVRETLRRCENAEVVLALHDTSTLSFRAEGKRRGFIEEPTTKTQQFWTHATLAVSGSRRPFGVLHLSTDTVIAHERWRKHVEHVEGLGMESPVVHIMDREADDFALFATMTEDKARFVIRLQHDRRLVELGEDGPLHVTDSVARPELQVEREVMLSSRSTARGSKQRRVHPARAGRVAHLAIAAARVRLRRPSSQPTSMPQVLELNFVRAWEPNPPQGENAVDWMLITSEPVSTADDMLRIVDWYRARWVIEEFFKALKTGCAVEQRQLETFAGLSKAVAFFAPIAWHLLLIRSDARETPDRPAPDVLPEVQLEALRAISRKPLPRNPNARDVALAIAALGGHLKRNGEPGWITLARGYEKLRLVAAGWRLARSDQS